DGVVSQPPLLTIGAVPLRYCILPMPHLIRSEYRYSIGTPALRLRIAEPFVQGGLLQESNDKRTVAPTTYHLSPWTEPDTSSHLLTRSTRIFFPMISMKSLNGRKVRRIFSRS